MAQVEHLQLPEPTQFRGEGARQVVGLQVECPQLAEPPQLRRDGAGQLVARQIQHLQLRELAQCRGDRAVHPALAQHQPFQPGQPTQLPGHMPHPPTGGGPLPDHLQADDPARLTAQADTLEVLNRSVQSPGIQVVPSAPQPGPHGQQHFLVAAQAGGRPGRGTRLRRR